MSEQQLQRSTVSFTLGECFQSFEEVKKKLEAYEMSTFTKFWKRDSRTIEGAKKRVQRPLSDKLIYYEVSYCCINGGRKFKPRGEGKRATR